MSTHSYSRGASTPTDDIVLLERDSGSSGSWEREDTRKCWQKKRWIALFFLGIIAAVVGGGMGVYFLARSIIANTKVEPNYLSTDVAGYKLNRSSEEYVKLRVNAAVSNPSFLGGIMLSTRMDVYVSGANEMGQEEEFLALSFTIPDTAVDAAVSNAQVQICKEKEDWVNGICALQKLTSDDLNRLHALVKLVRTQDYLNMRMVATNGVKLKSFGITLPFAFPFEKKFPAKAMNNALDNVKITTFKLKGHGEHDLGYYSEAVITNPSIFGSTILPAEFKLFSLKDHNVSAMRDCPDEIFLGDSYNKDVVALSPESSATIVMTGVLSRTIQRNCVNNFVQRYVNGKSNRCIAKIHNKSTQSQVFNTMLGGTTMRALLEDPLKCRGNAEKCELVAHVDMTGVRYLNPLQFFKKTFNGQLNSAMFQALEVNIHVHNPFENTKMIPLKYHIQVMYRGVESGNVTTGPEQIVIPGGEQVSIPVTLDQLNEEALTLEKQTQVACDLLQGELEIAAGPGTLLTVAIADFVFDISYVQSNVHVGCELSGVLQKACDSVMLSSSLRRKVQRMCKKYSPAAQKRYLTSLAQ